MNFNQRIVRTRLDEKLPGSLCSSKHNTVTRKDIFVGKTPASILPLFVIARSVAELSQITIKNLHPRFQPVVFFLEMMSVLWPVVGIDTGHSQQTMFLLFPQLVLGYTETSTLL